MLETAWRIAAATTSRVIEVMILDEKDDLVVCKRLSEGDMSIALSPSPAPNVSVLGSGRSSNSRR